MGDPQEPSAGGPHHVSGVTAVWVLMNRPGQGEQSSDTELRNERGVAEAADTC